MGARAETVHAIAEGQQAARDGQPVTVCPHPRGSILRTAWVRGYAQAAPPPSED